MLIVFTLATAIVIGAIVSLATGSWWFLALAVAAHAIGTTVVVRSIFKRVETDDEPQG